MKQEKNVAVLRKAVSELSYSREAHLSDEMFDATLSELKKMWAVYGYAEVLGELFEQWSMEKALPFFERLKLTFPQSRKVKTVATLYHRGYNGGCERVQAQLMTLWVNMGYRVVFFAEEPANPMDFPYPDEVKRILLPKVSNLRERLLVLQKMALEEGVDVLVNHDWSNCAVMWEAVLCKLLNISYVPYIHAHFSWTIPDSKRSVLFPRVCKLCDVVITLSETNARFFQLCGCNTYLVENPIPDDLEKISEVAPLNSRRILLVGRISKEKYPMDALRVFRLVHNAFPDTFLDVVGTGDTNIVNEMKEFCAENNLSDSVIFHGLKNNTEVNRFFVESACMLFTTKMEGYPMVLLEAKAHGLPVAMYDLSFLTLVKDKKGILVSPVGDIRDVAENIVRLLRDDVFRKACGRSAREDYLFHAAYDLKQAWTDVFMLCEHSGTEIVSGAYHDPNAVPEADRYIEPALLDAVGKAYDNILAQSIEYRVGKMLLRIPRAVKNALRKLKGVVKAL